MFSASPWMIKCPSCSSRKERFACSANCFSCSTDKLANGLMRIHFWSRGTPVMNLVSVFSVFAGSTVQVGHVL